MTYRALLLLFALLSAGITIAQSPIYIDFGPNDVTNGNITTNPDSNSKYWNNATDPTTGATAINLINKDNESTGISLTIASDLASNGLQNGGLQNPSEQALNDFAVATATQDYFFTAGTGSVKLSGLNTEKGYVFHLFGSRDATELRITGYSMTGDNSITGELQTSGTDLGGSGYHGNNSSIFTTDTVTPNSNGEIILGLKINAGSFAYLGALRLDETDPPTTSDGLCPTVNQYAIAWMGSSVAKGQGAPNNQGYAYQYAQQLSTRHGNGSGADWTMDNISIGGNNTWNVLDRWDSDLVPLCNSYVAYGLSLGNEGITSGGQAIFNQFRDNLLQLITQSREKGIEPLIVNCYARGDYSATDYAYVKDMNLLIHQWDVASINALGGLENRSGQWPAGYTADAWHPDYNGHKEMFHTIVPSLFDALSQGKPQPATQVSNGLHLNESTANYHLKLMAEEELHSYTHTFEFQTDQSGVIATQLMSNDSGDFKIDAQGWTYEVDGNTLLSGTKVLNDNQWHWISISHYHAQGITVAYIDGIEAATVSDQSIVTGFKLSGENSPPATYRDWMLHRSGMNHDEIIAMMDGKMLKSSLELYAPLNESGDVWTAGIANYAQSLNNVILAWNENMNVGTEMVKRGAVNISPNPVQLGGSFQIHGAEFESVDLHDVTGKKLKSLSISDTTAPILIRTEGWASGNYILRTNNQSMRLIIQ